MRLRTSLLALTLACLASAQWTDVRRVDRGGESTIASDNTGNVYLSAHLPSALFKSSDWGATFTRAATFPDSLGDMFVLVHGDGLVNVSYVRARINGIGSWYSSDGAKTMKQGANIEGSLDREWMVANPKTGRLFIDYSDGYIGGPKSKGVFLDFTDDNGASFQRSVRVDREPEGSYPVDPYLSSSSDGRLYSMWEVTKDYNTIESFRLATSHDGGKSFAEPITVADFPKSLDGTPVDTQERWMLGSVLGVGSKTVVVVYPGYESVQIDGQMHRAFVEHVKFSEDGGTTFGKGRTVLSNGELSQAILSFEQNRVAGAEQNYYIETLPWVCADTKGGIHIAFTDDRTGQATIGKGVGNDWQVRMVSAAPGSRDFGPSEQVSHVYSSKRPPMDFLSCAADSKFVYVSWTENPNSLGGWPPTSVDQFTGDLYAARRPLHLK